MSKITGLVFQNPDNQLFSASIHDEIEFSLRNSGTPESEIDQKIKDTLKLLDLSHLEQKSPFLLSGGERKRTAFATLICMDQPVFIADEPTQGQDQVQREKIKKILLDMQGMGKTIIVITHDLDFIMQMATRILVFENGKIKLDGKVQEIFKNEKSVALSNLISTQELELRWFFRKVSSDDNIFSHNPRSLIQKIISKVKGEY
jgi:energy-coupling factor transporter ATP-binding protein EcfA2